MKTTLLGIALILSLNFAKLAHGATDSGIDTTVNQPNPYTIYDNITLSYFASQEDADAYQLECANKPFAYDGDLIISEPWDSELRRCLRKINGNLQISPKNEVVNLTLPWLQTVTGTLKLYAGVNLLNAKLPRLTKVQQQITIDTRHGSTVWKLRNFVAHNAKLKIVTGPFSNLTGLNSLQSLSALELYTVPGEYPSISVTGLAGLTSLGSYIINTESGSASSDYLSQLTQISGNVNITTDDHVFGLGAVRKITGSLTIDLYAQFSIGTVGLEKLEEIGGNFNWPNQFVNSVSGLANLRRINGNFNINLAVNSLAGLSKLEHIGGKWALAGTQFNATVAPLTSLKYVGNFIIDNTLLTTLDGLNYLDTMGNLKITNNQKLGSVSALNGATMLSGASATITGNQPLTNCQARALVNSFVWQGTATSTITNNNNNSICILYPIIKITL